MVTRLPPLAPCLHTCWKWTWTDPSARKARMCHFCPRPVKYYAGMKDGMWSSNELFTLLNHFPNLLPFGEETNYSVKSCALSSRTIYHVSSRLFSCKALSLASVTQAPKNLEMSHMNVSLWSKNHFWSELWGMKAALTAEGRQDYVASVHWTNIRRFTRVERRLCNAESAEKLPKLLGRRGKCIKNDVYIQLQLLSTSLISVLSTLLALNGRVEITKRYGPWMKQHE